MSRRSGTRLSLRTKHLPSTKTESMPRPTQVMPQNMPEPSRGVFSRIASRLAGVIVFALSAACPLGAAHIRARDCSYAMVISSNNYVVEVS